MTLQCKTIYNFIKRSCGCKFMGKGNPRNPRTSTSLRTMMIPQYMVHEYQLKLLGAVNRLNCMVLEGALFGWTAWVVMEMNQMLRSVLMMVGVSPTAHMMRMLESSAKIILLVRRSYHIREY